MSVNVVRTLGLSLGLFIAVSGSGVGRVTRFVVADRAMVANGADWGDAGPYERLKGTAFMEVDPRDPLNAVIFNLDKAPRNARGMVEFSSSFLIFKPVDMRRGNQKLWFGVNNRGQCIETSFRSCPRRDHVLLSKKSCLAITMADIGANNILFRKGYVVVDAGWHGDGALEDVTLLNPRFPIARQLDGKPIKKSWSLNGSYYKKMQTRLSKEQRRAIFSVARRINFPQETT
jgi:hypothetical protein